MGSASENYQSVSNLTVKINYIKSMSKALSKHSNHVFKSLAAINQLNLIKSAYSYHWQGNMIYILSLVLFPLSTILYISICPLTNVICPISLAIYSCLMPSTELCHLSYVYWLLCSVIFPLSYYVLWFCQLYYFLSYLSFILWHPSYYLSCKVSVRCL